MAGRGRDGVPLAPSPWWCAGYAEDGPAPTGSRAGSRQRSPAGRDRSIGTHKIHGEPTNRKDGLPASVRVRPAAEKIQAWGSTGWSSGDSFELAVGVFRWRLRALVPNDGHEQIGDAGRAYLP